jgi:hypothetical protein
MSARQVMDITEALFMDETVGLAATMQRLAASLPNAPTGNPDPPSADFQFMRSPPDGTLKQATRGNVAIIADEWETNPRIGNDWREGMVTMLIDFESTSASLADAHNQAALVATAMAQCFIDSIREFSDVPANRVRFGACVVGVEPKVRIQFRYFEGPMTYGFRMRVTVQELSDE